jgi:hypothetical protein
MTIQKQGASLADEFHIIGARRTKRKEALRRRSTSHRQRYSRSVAIRRVGISRTVNRSDVVIKKPSHEIEMM